MSYFDATSIEQKRVDILRELVDICDPMQIGATPWTQRIRERFGSDDLDVALASAIGQLVCAANHVLQDIDT